jgi:glycosyltransferase involved in cell wall biosynthesis
MSNLPLISVITPSYNQANFLEDTMRSVLEQDYPRIEYIVVDGASTDRSVEIIRKYADRLAYWVSEKDAGQAAAINKGWSRSTGDILAFLNSDDCYLPGAVGKIVEGFQQNPESAIVYGQARWVTEDGAPLRSTHIFFDGQDMLDTLFQGIPQPATFVRRTVIETLGPLNPSFHFALDGEFFLRAMGNFRATPLRDTLATMRLHGASKSVSAGTGFIPDIMRIAEHVIAHPDAYPRYVVRPDDVRACAHVCAARYHNVANEHADALHDLWTSALLSKKYRARIFFRELPRVVAHTLLGNELYARLGAGGAALRTRFGLQ